ncbi:Transcriptional repressor TCF25 family protein [Theileria parva strain Muguga]|uniref:Transcriptional repressor TCF25 family protein n=1 Tax=Theileria parva strain Muguga TaxID=333668 RepID=UPI001C6184F0|nr:Transcriptional repressor TCF25 family protein [Theileria parva strain Muguga]EAN34248.2 Transcriptional repressor TCF25 family protein [Theileria parva strain Muguga]
MSSRQIRRLKERLKEESDEELERKFIIRNDRPKFSFTQLEDSSDSDTGTSSNDDTSDHSDDSDNLSDSGGSKNSGSSGNLDILNGKSGNFKNLKQDTQSSEEDSDWEKLLNEVTEVNTESISSSEPVSNHFLSSPQHYFRIKDMDKNKYVKSHGYSTRFWLCPSITTKESMQLRLLSSKLVEIGCETHDNRDRFTLILSPTYQEVDYLSSSALNTQDFELFRSLLHSNPTHLGLLIRSALINTITNNHEESFANLYLALKILQTILPHRFNLYRTTNFSDLTLPNVYLPCLGDNIVIYRLLILYMISLERKGQWQTALAVCKLLLAMDYPNDTSHALLHVDLYLLNSFSPDSSLIQFSRNYNSISPEMPLLYLFLPNFSLTLALQVYLGMDLKRNQCDLEEIKSQLPAVLDLDCDLAELAENPNPNTPFLLLIRSLLQFPIFIVKMSERVGTSGEVRNCAMKEPFSHWSSVQDLGYENPYDQLTRCYVYKCGDLWSSNNSTFLGQTATMLVQLYQDKEVRDLINQFQDNYFDFRNEIELPEEYTNVSITEFDLANYSLPMLLDFQT